MFDLFSSAELRSRTRQDKHLDLATPQREHRPSCDNYYGTEVGLSQTQHFSDFSEHADMQARRPMQWDSSQQNTQLLATYTVFATREKPPPSHAGRHSLREAYRCIASGCRRRGIVCDGMLINKNRPHPGTSLIANTPPHTRLDSQSSEQVDIRGAMACLPSGAPSGNSKGMGITGTTTVACLSSNPIPMSKPNFGIGTVLN